MKTVILTTALSDNYGAALQTFALAEAIKKLGSEATVYRYNNPKRVLNSMTRKQRIVHRIWEAVLFILDKGEKKTKFTEFREKYIPLTKTTFRTSDELKANFGDFDVYIAGSDQIWNPSFFIDDLSYFFDFLPADKKRISYASSFGKAEFGSVKYRDKCRLLLQHFAHISVREKSGIRIVKELCDADAECVLDPTLLLDQMDWMKLVNVQTSTEEIILCYTMPGDKKVTDSIEIIAKQLSKDTGLPIVRLGNKEYDVFKYGRKACDISAGPIEFVKYFLKAKYVVTNSFHGTAFSLNFRKKLLIPINNSIETKTALHERLLSIVEILGAKECLVGASEIGNSIDFSKHSVNYNEVSTKLEKERKQSFYFLNMAIGE